MDVYKARMELRTKRIQDIEMRVVHYDRVSTDKEEQKSSIVNQKFYSEEIIRNTPKWTYAGRYVDDAVSGLSVDKRYGFNAMIEDAKRGKFDFIITKEVPRFARNTLDSIKYSRELLNYGVGIWFINNNIVTLSEDSEFLLTIMAGQAQDESRRISSRVKIGHHSSIKRGHILGTDNMYGYKKENCKLTIDEATVGIVQYIFDQYATGNTSTRKLSNELFDMGYTNRYGGPISSKTVQNIIQNPKYKGFFCGGKVVIEDMFTKKQRFIPKSEWIMYKDENIPAIVSEEQWNAANEILNIRREQLFGDYKSTYKENRFTGKIICANDGAAYWLRARGKRNNRHDLTWECSRRKKEGAASCDSFALKETELVEIVKEILEHKMKNVPLVLDEYFAMLKDLVETVDFKKEILCLNKNLESIKRKRDKLLDHNLNGRVSDDDFFERDTEFKKEEEKIKNRLSEITAEHDDNELQKIEESVRRNITKLMQLNTDEIDKQLIDLCFEKIYAKKLDNMRMELTFKLNTGGNLTEIYKKRSANNQKQAQKNSPDVCRSDAMLKKMIEQQERQMAGK